jgi:DNA-binding beta-propeller fold protein YncE
MKGRQATTGPASQFRILWVCAIGTALLLQVFAVFRGGYVGPDYPWILERLLNWSKIFDFSTTSPPTYYLFGHALFLLIGRNAAFPITLSIIQATINALALWWFFIYTERRFSSPFIHLGLVFLLTFLPVRVIHATVLGTDWTTIPAFVLLLFCFDKFLRDETSTPLNATLFGLALALAVWLKYSFMALIPAVFLVVGGICIRRKWEPRRFLAICAMSLALPSALALHSFWASSRVHGYNTEKHWIPKGGVPGQPEMNYNDLLWVKSADLALFKAPEYWRSPEHRAPEYWPEDIRVAHKHSYLGLSHMGVFTDTMNLFQVLPRSQSIGRYLIPDFKVRRPWKTPVMQASVSLGALWTVLALIGTAWLVFRAAKDLYKGELEREDVLAFLGGAYFLLMFLPIPFTDQSAGKGYWTPRLILPPLLFFFCAGFLLIDRKIAGASKTIPCILLALAVTQSAIEIVMLARIDLTEPPVTAFEGGQGSGKGQFDDPRALAVDTVGNIFVADTNNGRIEKFSPNGTFVTSIATTDPNGIAVDRVGNIYVAEIGSKHRVQKLGPDGTLIADWTPGLYGPRKIAIGPDDSIYVVDSGRNRIVKFSPDGQILASWGSDGSGDGQFRGLSSVAVDAANNKVYVADPINSRIEVFDSNGKFLSKWSVLEWREALGYEDLAIDPDRGRLYASSAHLSAILVFDLLGNRLGALTPTPPDKLDGPSALALTKDKLLVLNTASARVSVIVLQNR